MASTPYGIPLSPAASSFAERPSTMKLLDRFRWLLIERPWPGTADVSANSCVLPVLVGDTPGISSARSRKFLPFIGMLSISACGTVPAIWLRAVSSTDASALTVTRVSSVARLRLNGRSNAEPSVRRRWRALSAKPSACTDTSYGPTFR